MATCTSSLNIVDSTFSGSDCGDVNIDISTTLSSSLSEVNTVEEFENIVYSELIDAKNRQSITAYPLLRLLYERYLNNNLCLVASNAYNYDTMQKISQMVGNYWVDLIEQFVPATAIWGSTLVYRNTVFDTQKYAYKSNTLFLCEDPSGGFQIPTISNDCDTQVIKIQLTSNEPPAIDSTPFDSSNFFSCEQHVYCDCVWTMTNYCSPEFIGKIIGAEDFYKYCINDLSIDEVELNMTVSSAPGCNAQNQTWDSTNRIFTQILKITDSSSVQITTEYNYSVTTYGNNPYNITMTLIKLDTNTIQIDWDVPVSAPEPIATSCPGYYTIPSDDWKLAPLVTVTEPDFNCEINKLFISNPTKY